MEMMMSTKIKYNPKQLEVWLDLEGTVINTWDDGLFLQHVQKIKDYLEIEKPTHLNIWSFAMWYEKHRIQFDASGMKERIEQCFGLEIIEYPSVDDMIELCKPADSYFRYDHPHEFMQINGKYWSFIKHAMSQTSKKLVLIDDAVPHSVIQFPHRNVEVLTLNIEKDF